MEDSKINKIKDLSIQMDENTNLSIPNVPQSSGALQDVNINSISSHNIDKPEIDVENLFQNFSINYKENNGNNESKLNYTENTEELDKNIENITKDLNKNEVSNIAILELSSRINTPNAIIEDSIPGSNSILQPIDPNTASVDDRPLIQSSLTNRQQINNNSQINMTSPSVEYRQQIVKNQSSGIQIPIIGYEIMEERARFTIYKLRIDDPRTGLSWMVFRRYTDFVRLYSKLKIGHPTMCLPIPGKRRFKDNFDPRFLDDRIRGLQIFINSVIRNLSPDPMVRDFFCLDEPPPVCDSEPESLALFSALEDTVKSLKNQLRQKEETLTYLRNKVIYFEDKMKCCENCNPGYQLINAEKKNNASSPGSSSSR